ncbi:hypothetical protein [Natronoglycomyces albus]|uniref:CHRD domain-containing protein n=1 Tax=Natronoglycomyces albus TaxID=2811108 RepID=A0A895XK20_9ACTN|nr:hypothetical protein [Natronoglycomyces albus]QSB06101.1 hypothetical protein JQS30_04060 [Natronoglycomyces albus]
MRTSIKKPLAIAGAISLGVLFSAGGVAQAQEDDWDDWAVFQADLQPLNNQQGWGEAWIEFDGDQNEATISISYEGLAEEFDGGPFPHAQHIHINGNGVCPDESADEDGDGLISTTEGHHAYGDVGTSLTTEGDTSPDSALAIDRFPGGSNADYERTIVLDDENAAQVWEENAVIVIHGVDPTLISEEAAEKESDLDPDLPMPATAPALCGSLLASQMGQMPEGAPDTGGGFIAEGNAGLMFGAAAATFVAAVLAAGYALRTRSVTGSK